MRARSLLYSPEPQTGGKDNTHHEAALLCYDCDNLSRLDGCLLNAIQSSSILISSYLFVTFITRCIPGKMKPCQQKKVRCKQTLSEIDKYQHLTVMAVVLPGETDDKGRCRSEIISYSPNDIPEKPTNQSDGTISRLPHRVERAYIPFRAGYKECTCVFVFLEVAGLDDKGKIWYTFFNEDQLGWEAAITLGSEYYLSGIGKNPGLKPDTGFWYFFTVRRQNADSVFCVFPTSQNNTALGFGKSNYRERV